MVWDGQGRLPRNRWHRSGPQRPELEANRSALTSILPHSAAPTAHFCYPSGICSSDSGAVLARLHTTRQGIAWPGTDPYFLPRLLDGEQLTELEFEAELSGFADMLRGLRVRLLPRR